LRWTFAFDNWLVVVVRLEVDGLSVDVVQHEDVVFVLGFHRSFGVAVFVDSEAPDVNYL
jgi:hypothetical protein